MIPEKTLALILAGAWGSACATPAKTEFSPFIDIRDLKTTAEVERDFYTAYRTLLSQTVRADQERTLDALADHARTLLSYSTRMSCDETKTMYENARYVLNDAVAKGIRIYDVTFFDKTVSTIIMGNLRVLDALADKCEAETKAPKEPPRKAPSVPRDIILL